MVRRPYIPIAARVQVLSLNKKLKMYLLFMFGNRKVELRYRPQSDALNELQEHIPDANDPDSLVYVPIGQVEGVSR